MPAIILLVFAVGGFVNGKSFLSPHSNATARSSWTSPAGCPTENIESCERVDIDLGIIKSDDHIELPDGTQFLLVSRDESNAVFQTASDASGEAIFTWSGSNVVGSVHHDGDSWQLQGCGENCYLWIKYGSNWPEEGEVEFIETSSRVSSASDASFTELLAQGRSDSNQIVDYSVMIWYTPQFKESFISDVQFDIFIEKLFTETNQGYKNSRIPVRAVKHDVKQHPTLTDIRDSKRLLYAFRNSMSKSDLLNCADSAVLLVKDTKACGYGFVNTVFSCNTFSITKKSCATGYFSFGHELSHNFGAHHNPEALSEDEEQSGDGYGHLIQPTGPTKYSGYRTIMAYHADGHSKRVNYYSNPDVLFKNNPTGIEGLSNNARVITANRFAMASCGTECNVCCETVTIASTDPDWLVSYLVGTYTKYTSSPSLNGQMVYKHQYYNFCLYFTEGDYWAINDCSTLSSQSYYMRTNVNKKKCVHSEGLVWENFDGIDDTVSTKCSLARSSVTNSFDETSSTTKLLSTTTMAPTTSIENITTTTTTITAFPEPIVECGHNNKAPYLNKLKTTDNVATAKDCQEMCGNYPGCQFFKWKTNRRSRRRSCQFLAVSFKAAGGGVTSGSVTC